MAEITINGVKYTNVPNKKAGTKFAASLTQSNIGASQAVQDYVNSAYFYPLVNAIDINWNGVEVDDNSYINTTSDLITYIATKGSSVDLSSYATVDYVNQQIEDVIGGAPETLDTLKELADALGEEASLAYVTQALDGKADKSSLTNYATNSYVTTELDKKADKSDIPAAPDLTPYVTYTQANSYYSPKYDHIFHRFNDSTKGVDIAYLVRPGSSSNLSDIINKVYNVNGYSTLDNSSELIILSTLNSTSSKKISIGGGNSIIGGGLMNRYGSSYTYLSNGIFIGRESQIGQKFNNNQYVVNSGLFIGDHIVSNSDNQYILGNYNALTNNAGSTIGFNVDTTMFAIGNGSSDNARHNAFEVRKNGKIYIADTFNGTPYVLQTKLNSKADLSYVTSELANKANLSDIPAAPDLTPYVSYTQANSYYALKDEQVFYNLTEAGVGVNIAYTIPTQSTNYIASKLDSAAVGYDSFNSLVISTIHQDANLKLNLANTIISGELYKPNPVDSQYVSTYLTDSIAVGSNITAYWMQSENIYKPVANCLIVGENLVSRNSKQLIVGKWNECTYLWWDKSNPQGQTMFAVGNGAKNARHNAFEVRDNGDIYIADTKNGTPYRLQDRLDMSSYVPMTSYNALLARVEELAGWIVSYHTPTPEPEPTGIFAFEWGDMNMNIGDVLVPPITNTYEYSNITYLSSDNNIFTVDGNGECTAVGSGNASLTASLLDNSNNVVTTASLAVIVGGDSGYDFNFDDEYINMNIGDTVTPSITNTSEYTIISYTSSDSSVVSVDGNGTCTALTLGQATISATLYDNNNNEQAFSSVQLNVTSPTPTFEGYWTYNGMRTDSITVSTSDPNMTLSFVSNPTIASGIGRWSFFDMPSSGVTINTMNGEMTIDPSKLDDGSVYSGVGYQYQNDGESTEFYITITVTSSTPPTKIDPTAQWTANGTNYSTSIIVNQSQGLTTLTFSGTPLSGWTFTDPMISGITVDTSTGSITVDPAYAEPSIYNVTATYPGDATYNDYTMTFAIKVES